jgi:hypothetical protein
MAAGFSIGTLNLQVAQYAPCERVSRKPRMLRLNLITVSKIVGPPHRLHSFAMSRLPIIVSAADINRILEQIKNNRTVPLPRDQLDAALTEVLSGVARFAWMEVKAVYDAVAEPHPSAMVIIPPRATSVAGKTTATQRDRHLAMMDEHGRMGWQRRQVTTDGVWLEQGCFATKPLSAGDCSRELCPIRRSRQKSAAMCSTE